MHTFHGITTTIALMKSVIIFLLLHQGVPRSEKEKPLFLSQKVAMETLCASVSREAQKKQQKPQTFKKKKNPPGIFLTKIEGGNTTNQHTGTLTKLNSPGSF